MIKKCVIYNSAPHYRKGIFKLLDQNYQIDWYFGENLADIKQIELSFFKSARYLKTVNFKGGYLQLGALKLLFKKEYDTILMLGEIRNISSWLILIFHRLFVRKKHLYLWSHAWYGKESKLISFFKKIYFKLADLVFTYGDYARNLMIERGFDPRKIVTIHNSLDYDIQLSIRSTLSHSQVYKEHFCNDNPVLLFIGRLTPVKRLDILLNSFMSLQDNYNLVIIGSGEMEETLKGFVISHNIKNVWFYGPSYDEVKNAELIYNADLCVSPGNVGLTAMHAMVYGTPVLTHSDYPHQMPEFEAIKEGITGSFFKRDDSADLSDKVVKWFQQNHNKREEIRRNCNNEIDLYWTPQFQFDQFCKYL